MKWPTPRRSIRIARIEYQRSLRAIGKNPIQLLGTGVFVLFFIALPTAGGVYTIYHFGDQIAELPFLLPIVRGGTALGWLGFSIVFATRAVGKTARIDYETVMLTTVAPRDVVGGLLLAELVRVLSVVAIPLLALSVTWTVVLGTPVPVVAIPLTLVIFLVSALLTGHLFGILFKTVFARSALLTRHKTVIFALMFLAYMGVVMSNTLGTIMARLGALLQDVPLAWFGDALLLGVSGVDPSLARISGAIGLVMVGVPALLLADVRAATQLWYMDAVKLGAKDRSRQTALTVPRMDSVGGGLLTSVASRPTRSVTANVWRRTRRAPIRLIYVIYPLFVFTGFLQGIVSTGEMPASFPVMVALYGTWAIGATALNPFGDEGAMLPLTLISTIRGDQFVRGYALAATLVGLPLVVVATAITGVVSPLEPIETLALTVVSAVLGVVGAVVAIGVGTVFPRFGEVRVTRSRHVVVPSKTAFAVYSLVVVLGFGAAAVAAVPAGAAMVSMMIELLSTSLLNPIEISAESIRIAGGVVTICLGVVAPPVAYRYTVRQFETYTLDKTSESWTALFD